MRDQVNKFWENVNGWNKGQLIEAKRIINSDRDRCRSNRLDAGLSDFARRSLGLSIQISGNMIRAINDRLARCHILDLED